MSLIPLVLPLKANEAAALADLAYQQLEGHSLSADLRNRFAARLPQLALETFTPFPGSLARDRVHPSTYYLAIETPTAPLLLCIAPASYSDSGLFPGAMPIGRMRPGGGREIVINAVPFNFTDHDNIRTFATQVDPAFLPRPQGLQSAIVVDKDGPDFAPAFRAFQTILKTTGLNLAACAENYEIAQWSAIRAGWREGWNAQSSDSGRPEYTKYSVQGTSEEIEETYDRIRAMKAGCIFDFEIATLFDNAALAGVGTSLDGMKSRGKPVQFLKVHSGSGLRQLALIARQYDAILSFDSDSPLEEIGVATGGRFHYRMRGGEEDICLAASSLLGKSI